MEAFCWLLQVLNYLVPAYMHRIQSIAFFGAGNVASQMARQFLSVGLKVTALVHEHESRSPEDEVLSQLASTDPEAIFKQHPDLIIIAVQDSAISKVAHFLESSNNQIPVVHTSGGQASDLLMRSAPEYGAFYPLQTITSGEAVLWNEVPFCICANRSVFEDALIELAGRISREVHRVGDEERRWLHLAAVMQNNFVNHIMARTADVLEHRSLKTDLLQPLLRETIRKASDHGARHVQTGPARRNDEATRDIHLAMLNELDDEHLSELYHYFWRSIQAYYDISGEGEEY